MSRSARMRTTGGRPEVEYASRSRAPSTTSGSVSARSREAARPWRIVASGDRTTWRSGVPPSHRPVSFEFEATTEAHDARGREHRGPHVRAARGPAGAAVAIVHHPQVTTTAGIGDVMEVRWRRAAEEVRERDRTEGGGTGRRGDRPAACRSRTARGARGAPSPRGRRAHRRDSRATTSGSAASRIRASRRARRGSGTPSSAASRRRPEHEGARRADRHEAGDDRGGDALGDTQAALAPRLGAVGNARPLRSPRTPRERTRRSRRSRLRRRRR